MCCELTLEHHAVTPFPVPGRQIPDSLGTVSSAKRRLAQSRVAYSQRLANFCAGLSSPPDQCQRDTEFQGLRMLLESLVKRTKAKLS